MRKSELTLNGQKVSIESFDTTTASISGWTVKLVDGGLDGGIELTHVSTKGENRKVAFNFGEIETVITALTAASALRDDPAAKPKAPSGKSRKAAR